MENEQMQQESSKVEDLTFRQAMAELEQIVNKLESNTLELEESLRHYERGVALIVSLKSRLTQAQQKVMCLWVNFPLRPMMPRRILPYRSFAFFP